MSDKSELKLWHIDDGGEDYWYAAISDKMAIEEHIKIMYTQTGEDLPDEAFEASPVDDARIFTFVNYGPEGSLTLSAADWCKAEGPGLIASSCY